MLEKELLAWLKRHVSSLSLFLILMMFFLTGETAWLDPYLPINGKPLVGFLLLGLIVVYELSISGQKVLVCKVDDISRQMQVNRLVHSVNTLHGRYEDSGDEYITNEYTIKELADLTDMRDELGVNSYVQGRLEHLNSKIKRD